MASRTLRNRLPPDVEEATEDAALLPQSQGKDAQSHTWPSRGPSPAGGSHLLSSPLCPCPSTGKVAWHAARGLAAAAAAGLICYSAVFVVYWTAHTRSPMHLAATPVLARYIENPVLGADFRQTCTGSGECPPFLFGLATAPAHVEDQLNDSWLDWAHERNSAGETLVKGWSNAAIPEQRLRFWTEPEQEVALAQATGVGVLRLGVDWGRIVPKEPPLESMGDSATLSVVDWAAVERYKQILRGIQDRGMKVMLTLFHHSFPKWGLAWGDWLDPRAVTLFVQFARIAAEHFGPQVDFWVTFNEPQIFVRATHCWCDWPRAPKGLPGGECRPTKSCNLPWGEAGVALGNIAEAHNLAYPAIKQRSSAPIGVAHDVAYNTPYSFIDMPIVVIQDYLFRFSHFVDKVVEKLDFCGLNYYGQEFVSVFGLLMVQEEEYSESGRAVYPDGLFKLLIAFHNRYRQQHPSLRYMITENGIADGDDTIRRAYIVEHLAALQAAMRQGVPVDAYVHWTISDNWEWADGYCPKFGLVEVQREANLTRVPRPSYSLYKEVVKSQALTPQQRKQAWSDLQTLVASGKPRPICRVPDSAGMMTKHPLDFPAKRDVSPRDWRFGKYRHVSSLTMLTRSASLLLAKFSSPT